MARRRSSEASPSNTCLKWLSVPLAAAMSAAGDGDQASPCVARNQSAGVAPIAAAKSGRRGAWAQVGYALDGWVAGLRGERGVPAWF